MVRKIFFREQIGRWKRIRREGGVDNVEECNILPSDLLCVVVFGVQLAKNGLERF